MAMSNYLENKLIDQIFRAQAYSFPSILYFGLLTAAPSDTGGGTEVSADSYDRVAVTGSLSNFSGTQGAGTTTASTGTSGTTSNNVEIQFASPGLSEDWGRVTHMAMYDAATGGNLLLYGALANPKTINAGDDAPSFPASTFSYQIDS